MRQCRFSMVPMRDEARRPTKAASTVSPALIQGSFTVRVTRSGYETAEVDNDASTAIRISTSRMRALPPPPFTGATFDVKVAVSPNQCGISLPSSGRLVLSGNSTAPDDPRDSGAAKNGNIPAASRATERFQGALASQALPRTDRIPRPMASAPSKASSWSRP